MVMLRIPLDEVLFFWQIFTNFDLKNMISTYTKNNSWKK
jgi:hypothetical protein